jgi:hypothetical protein
MRYWIQTHSGIAFDLEHPTVEMVNPDDIAHALARINRFSGHTREPYSVAQHSVYVARAVARYSPKLGLAALLHDAHEAYIGDITSPVCALLSSQGARIKELKHRINCVVALRFEIDLGALDCKLVRSADARMLATEARCLLAPPPRSWGLDAEPYDDMTDIHCWDYAFAEEAFRDALALQQERAK